ncbi:hypothetical protein DL89DRAFT_266769 [Linderina pennispora]|uniref:TRUD domain-containing protein n=1 Tax=Linderina pennispora TaxID=61395 RepID=A0A1Y1WAL5_9FUNG|nr:uncharacterized protein DL89DRAFT_266769 [Linderina pennispora]ORX70571.1 hypothetical protein DL89DRAFT_266769 [Linderina pennispora]
MQIVQRHPKDGDDLEVPEDPKEAFEEVLKHMVEILGAKDAQHIRTLLESGVTNNPLPTGVSVNTQIRQMMLKRVSPNSKPKSGRRPWKNCDSMDILNQLAKLLRVKPGRSGTVQRVLGSGSFSYAPRDLSLDDFSGNPLQIVLRFEVINYFGLQWFGSSSMLLQAVDTEVLKVSWQKAVDLWFSCRARAISSRWPRRVACVVSPILCIQVQRSYRHPHICTVPASGFCS